MSMPAGEAVSNVLALFPQLFPSSKKATYVGGLVSF